jgi:hypothetical protein
MNRKQRKRKQQRRTDWVRKSMPRTEVNEDAGESIAEIEEARQDDQSEGPALDDIVAEAPARIAALREELVEVLAPFDAFDVIANLWVVNSPFDPDTYRESAQEGLMSVSDYVALLCAERPSRAATGAGGGMLDGPILDRIDGIVRAILGLTDLTLTAEARAAKDPFEVLRRQVVSRRMFVQGPGFDFQEEALIDRLFEEERTRAELLDRVGFGARDGLAIGEAIVEVALNRFSEQRVENRDVAALLAKVPPESADDLGDPFKPIVAQLAQLSEAEKRAATKRLEIALSFSSLGRTMAVRANEVAAQSGVEQVHVKAYLDTFSTSFGRPTGSGFGTELQTIRERPLLVDGDGNYLLVSHLALFWALRPALEEGLKNTSSWHRFERLRGKEVERLALSYLASAMPGSRSWQGVSFSLEVDGEVRNYDIDGLLVCDTVMFVVEGKSAPLGAASRRGAPARLQKQLNDLLVKAAIQADRARRALAGPGTVFRDPDGGVIALPDQVSEIIPIVVTLENLSEITTAIWELQETGLLEADVPVPWALNLYELELICDLTEYPAMLVQFFRRRSRLNELRRVHAGDELDWWMHYLERGLYFERELEESEPPDSIHLLSMTDPLDAYYLWQRGARTTPAKKPRQKLPTGLRALMDSINDQAPSGYLEAEVALLELDAPGRRGLVRAFRRIREATTEDDEFHNLSITIREHASLGITCMAAPGADRRRLKERLAVLITAKKHQTRLRRWIGLGWCAETPSLIDVVDLAIGEWTPDPQLDELLQEMGLEPSNPLSNSDPVPVPPKGLLRPPATTRGRTRRR